MGLERRVHELRDVGARIGEGDHGPRVAHQLEGVVLVLVGDRLEKEELEILRQREVDHGFRRMLAALAGDLGDRAMRSLDGIEDEEPIVVGELRPRCRAGGGRRARRRLR